jgi:hypothetical protein
VASVHAEAETQTLVDRMMTALGGRDAIESLRSLAVEADCTGPGGEFRTRVESFRPGATYFHQAAGERATEIWSTAERTWRRDAEAGLVELDQGVRSFVRGHEFHLLLFELESRFSNRRLADATEIQGRACRLIVMEDESGHPASICIDESDGMPVVLEMNPPGAEGPIRIHFDDWREVEGLRYFHSFELTEGPARTFTYRYQSLQPDSVAADRFVPPVAPALQGDQNAILEILRSDRRAHLTTDAALLTSHLASTLVEIYAGEVRSRSRSEVEEFFRVNFRGATYQVWEDIRPPVIRLSAGAKMAWVVRTVHVRLQASNAEGRKVLQEFTSAFNATYEKQGDAWKMTSVTSTFLPAA